MDRGGDPGTGCGFNVCAEGDEQAAAGASAGSDVVTFDPVVDDVGADPEHGGDVCDGELVVWVGLGCVGMVDVS